MDREGFARAVRETLEHLHNRSFLATHPLAAALGTEAQPLGPDRLRAELLDAIEQLRPVSSDVAGPDARRHRHLVLRYQRGQSLEQIGRALGVSSRQATRDHQQALEELVALLWLRRRDRLAPADRPDEPSL